MPKRLVIFVHRWLGVALCLLVVVWFSSGIGMMYWEYPDIGPEDLLERSPPLDASTIALSPENAYARLGESVSPGQVRLGTFDGRPVYRFGVFGQQHLVYADTGERHVSVSDEMMQRIVSRWSGRPAERRERRADSRGRSVDGSIRNPGSGPALEVLLAERRAGVLLSVGW